MRGQLSVPLSVILGRCRRPARPAPRLAR